MPKVDTRQPKEMITPFVRAGWIPAALQYGDYEILDVAGEAVLIEDKPIGKLLSDMTSGVLQRQCRAMVENSTFPILLIRGHWAQEGGYLYGEKRERFTWEQVWNQLQTLQDIGIRLQIVTSMSHAIERIFELQEYYSHEFHASIARHPSGDPYITALSLVYGISATKAKEIKLKFPYLQLVANADLGELAEVFGIGAKLAKRLYEFWR